MTAQRPQFAAGQRCSPQCVTPFLSARLPTSDHLQEFRRFCGRSAAKLLAHDERASLPATLHSPNSCDY